MNFDPDTQARLFYLVLLGAFILVAVFTQYRGRLGQAAQHAAIWALIFIGAVIAIGFKDQLTGQLYSSYAVPAGEGVLAFRRAADGHFYVGAEVNGAPVRFMVDTGATQIVLTPGDARAAGIDTDALNFIQPTYTANGRVMSAPVRLDRVALGDAVDQDVPASVSSGGLGQSLLGMRYLDLWRSMRIEGDTLYLAR
ncbi:MAG TPA: TIGR02281 family clan AA aspartic protease [Paracoccaceae bacterium]|nr:TIGR02281 family clan AA aspartic protease [Paracoccaceae bacterium]